jgi:VWFA-related protein
MRLRDLRFLILLLLSVCVLRAQTPAATPAPLPDTAAGAQAGTPAAQTAPSAAVQTQATPAQGAAAQPGQNAAPFTLQVSSRLVVLDFVAVDGKGNALTDLKRDDFHVEEAGTPEDILNFELPGSHTPDPLASIESTADLDRLAPRAPVNIILLDEFNTRFEDMAFAQYSLKKFLEKQPAKLSTPTMLIAVSLDHFTVLRDYTQSKDELLTALAHNLAVNPWQQEQGAWVGERYATAFVTLRRVAQATIGHRGHKNMLWIGRGFPALNWRGQPSIDVENRISSAVQNCVNTLRDARITLYTIDPAGVMVDPNEYGGFFSGDPFGGNYEFNRLALATGGRTLYGRNDVNNEIATAIADGSSFYTLTYRPTIPVDEVQKFRRIVVTVDRPGIKVIAREGYYPRSGAPAKPFDAQNPSKTLVRDLIAADSSAMVYDGVPLRLQPSPTDPDTFVVHVDGKGLVWTPATDTEPRHADAIIMISTFDKKGKELKRVAKSIRANAPATVPPTGKIDRGLDLSYKMDHDPKAVRARFVVRVMATNRTGTADADLLAQAAPAALPAKTP